MRAPERVRTVMLADRAGCAWERARARDGGVACARLPGRRGLRRAGQVGKGKGDGEEAGEGLGVGEPAEGAEERGPGSMAPCRVFPLVSSSVSPTKGGMLRGRRKRGEGEKGRAKGPTERRVRPARILGLGSEFEV